MPAKNPAPKEVKKLGKGQAPVAPAPAATPSATDKKVGKTTKPHAMPPVTRNTHRCRPHEYQDARYGDQMRVLNACKDKALGLAHRCTVCGTVTA